MTATFTLVEQGPIDDLADGGTWYRFAGRLWSGSASTEVALGLTLVRVGDTLAEFGVLVPATASAPRADDPTG